MPDGVHGGWSNAMVSQQVIESFEMASFLIVHVLHQRTEMRVCLCDWRSLGRVDESCGQFSSMIDAESLVQEFLLGCSERLGSICLWCVALDIRRVWFARCMVDGG